ncbi:hypothetical protein MNBD_GAMMA12-686 [hydrothermal vent metagenome]|uniref:Response regulatory domain-containing protein n=1 Tax=hydrothermal vent metagenome TaxID=652676 RepID=A0A3B0YY30_9ZZZZ
MSNPVVLVVDDSKLSRMMIVSIIQAQFSDWNIIEASNGDEALEVCSGKNIGLFIIDYNMPGMDGLALAAKLKENFPSVPMSLLTANIQKATKVDANKIGIKFFPKPITQERVESIFSLVA